MAFFCCLFALVLDCFVDFSKEDGSIMMSESSSSPSSAICSNSTVSTAATVGVLVTVGMFESDE